MKSNCGCLLIDDFGRQRVAPAELLNRWIVPLESRNDFLTLPTGKKISVPFQQIIHSRPICSLKSLWTKLLCAEFLSRSKLAIQAVPSSSRSLNTCEAMDINGDQMSPNNCSTSTIGPKGEPSEVPSSRPIASSKEPLCLSWRTPRHANGVPRTRMQKTILGRACFQEIPSPIDNSAGVLQRRCEGRHSPQHR